MESNQSFDRWNARERSTWPFQVFQKYNLELTKLYWSFVPAHKTLYNRLGSSHANWTDASEQHLVFKPASRSRLFGDLKDWSNAFNSFANWTRLNVLMAILSNFESYTAAVLQLALESDPGVLIGAPRSVDGLSLHKRHVTELNHDKIIEACTKGDWSSRVSHYEATFGFVPAMLKAHISDLDAMRNLRNKVGHAFGRDISQARRHGVREIIPMESLSEERVERYQRLAWSSAKSIDRHLLTTHIGEYQALHFYHKLFPTLRSDVNQGQRAVYFRKALGQFHGGLPGKAVCKAMVEYYEAL